MNASKLVFGLALSIIAGSAFALPTVETQQSLNSAAAVQETAKQTTLDFGLASDGAERVGTNRQASDGADHIGANRLASDGADRVGASRSS